MSMDYQQAMDFLNQLPVFLPEKVKNKNLPFNLDSIRVLLKKLGNPEKKLKYIHVAGTNGKGSTCAFLRTILTRSGIRTGSYTSPALHRFTERIRVDGKEIEHESVGCLMERIKHEADRMRQEDSGDPSEFEIVLAMAFLYFVERECSLVILETGLGGDLDATNVIPAPELAIITAVSYDHMELLGNTLPEIAWHKAGIIKEGTTVLMYPQEPEVSAVFEQVCKEKKADLIAAHLPERADQYDREKQVFSLDDLGQFEIPLLGTYQIKNAAMAVYAAKILQKKGYPVSMDAIKTGLSRTCWQGRFELIQEDPVIIVDGGHNVQGAKVLVQSIQRLFPEKKVRFVTGVLKDKQYEQMMEILIPAAECFYTITPPSPRALDGKKLAGYLRSRGQKARAFSEVAEAVSHAKEEAGREDVICVCGSLYFIGQITN